VYQYEENIDFHALGQEIKRKREEKGWTQEYLAQLVARTPRSIMYMEN
jgi:transcriptional regulator with XRE-family HTH domain